MGLVGGLLACELGLRAAAPLLSMPMRAFVEEEAYQGAQSALRVAKAVTIILKESDFERGAKVVVVGDSFVFGTQVSIEDLFTSRLARLVGTPVLNLGVGSQGPCCYNHMLRFAVSRLPVPPKLMVYTVFANDFLEGPCSAFAESDLFMWDDALRRNTLLRLRMKREWLLQHSLIYHLAKRHLTFGSLQTGAAFTPVPYEKGSIRLLLAPVSWWLPQLDLQRPQVVQGLERTLGKIQEGHRIAARAGARFLVVLMPFKEQIYGPMLLANPGRVYSPSFDEAYDWIQHKSAASNIETVDLRHVFREQARRGGKLYWTLDGHLTPRGHEVTAAELASRIAGAAAL
jgi:hypothetical protein